ncbi:hypothetical protein [Xanthomonas arboricola]|uniref:hypothetical protein n=1 Tax=Xanthomonas arboricola TaxID=56448 RepID=UPI001430D772|nr:hypothetical protein [Xanthomonas arboricola]NJB78356.1 hypothetical protein [Xanthomonas arboricola]CAD2243674.1 hypothetical protein X12_000656 [Xanthomonas arboricola]
MAMIVGMREVCSMDGRKFCVIARRNGMDTPYSDVVRIIESAFGYGHVKPQYRMARTSKIMEEKSDIAKESVKIAHIQIVEALSLSSAIGA